MSTYQEERNEEVKVQRLVRRREWEEFERTSKGGRRWFVARLQLAIKKGMQQLPLFPVDTAGSE